MADLQPFDFHRIFWGDAPLWFGLEIAFRTVVMYLFALLSVRIVSRRAVGELSFIEFLLVVALGSAVGDPMFYQDVPLVHGMIVIATVVVLSRGVTGLVNRNETAERLLEGRPMVLVEDGRMRPDELKNARLNREKLFELLRVEGVEHLGELHRVYMEQRGELSIVRRRTADVARGLRVSPPWDSREPKRLTAGDPAPVHGALGCEWCGHVETFAKGETLLPCPECGGRRWANAVVSGGAAGATASVPVLG